MSGKVKLKDVTGETPAVRKVMNNEQSAGAKPLDSKASEAAFVDEFSTNAAIGVISAGLSALLLLVIGLVATAFSVKAIFLIVPGVVLAVLAYLMLKKSRIAAMLSFGIWLFFIAYFVWDRVVNSGTFSVVSLLDLALLVGLWKGVEGISGYHQHQKELWQKGAFDTQSPDAIEEVFE